MKSMIVINSFIFFIIILLLHTIEKSLAIEKSTKSAYSGYANSDDASNKKIIKNLFKQGQSAFNSGKLN